MPTVFWTNEMKPLRVMTILGTRPEIIRLSRVIARLDQLCDHRLVHTGQNHDHALNEIFFQDLGVRRPDHFLNAGGGSLGETLGRILIGTERVIAEVKPEAVLVLGDTNSAISVLMARRMKVPIYHMEAGNRSFDRNVPEETNRRLVDHIADFNLVYTEHARRHLLSEGIEHRRIYLTGSPMREVMDHYRDRIRASDALERLGLSPGGYFVASLHREENVDSRERLSSLLRALAALARIHERPVIVSTHPRTRKRLDALGMTGLGGDIRFLEPQGFFDYNRLQTQAFCVVSDSGSITEEAAILDFPAVTPRDAIERPEGLDAGCILMSGVGERAILRAVEAATRMFAERRSNGQVPTIPVDYMVTNTSERVAGLILGTASLSNAWDGIRVNDLG